MRGRLDGDGGGYAPDEERAESGDGEGLALPVHDASMGLRMTLRLGVRAIPVPTGVPVQPPEAGRSCPRRFATVG